MGLETTPARRAVAAGGLCWSLLGKLSWFGLFGWFVTGNFVRSDACGRVDLGGVLMGVKVGRAGAALVCGALVVGATLGSSPAVAGAARTHRASKGSIASAPLSSMVPSRSGHGVSHPAKRLRSIPSSRGPVGSAQVASPTAALSTHALALDHSFDGVGDGFTGPQGTFSVTSAPPDTTGDVGPNHFVQMVNTDLAVFSKTGTVLYGPVPTNTLWSGFGGHCQSDNDGDGSVIYDRAADRWILAQFANASSTVGPFYECVAVSQTGDPTGAYYRYVFQYANFPDYPKLGVWPDGYYATYNMFNPAGTAFLGAQTCAFDRTSMLAGLPATQQCFSTVDTATPNGLLPSHLDGATSPPAGAPNYLVGIGPTAATLTSYQFHVDWTTPANSTLTGPTALNVDPFNALCGGGTCVPQAGTTNRLDSLADRLMYRLDYRNFGDHASLVVGHAITGSPSGAGMRWYELRVIGGAMSVFQQGTYAPDTKYRWMGSLAVNGNGDIGMGFSVSSGTTHPGFHVTGRLAADPAGTMPQGETTIIDGAGSQTGGLTRWADYSTTTVDPTDDCTFWSTNEYIPANGSFNWRTRIGTFRLAGCGAPPAPPKVSIGDATVVQPNRGTATARFTVTLDTPQTSAVTVAFRTINFNAVAPTDYTARTSTVNIAAGAVQAVVAVTVKGQAGASADKAFVVQLDSLTGGTGVVVGRTAGVGFILDATAKADATISVGDTTVVEPNSKTLTAHFTLNLAGSQAAPLTIHYQTTDGTATAPGEYATKSGTLTFAAGVVQKDITITIVGDINASSNEVFTIALSNPSSGVSIFRSTGTGTVLTS